MSSAKRRPFWLGPNMLIVWYLGHDIQGPRKDAQANVQYIVTCRWTLVDLENTSHMKLFFLDAGQAALWSEKWKWCKNIWLFIWAK